MDVENGIRSPGSVGCRRDSAERLRWDAVLAGGRAEEPSHPSQAPLARTDNSCLGTGAPGSARSAVDVQVCKKAGLDNPLSVNSLQGEQVVVAPTGNPTAANPAAAPEIRAEGVPSVSDDFSEDDLEYFECSDVLTEREEEMWKRKLRFLLESDDEDDLQLSQDCDGCAYFLGETPCGLQVSDNTTPMDPPIGFWGHHSTFKGVDVRRDPSVHGQATLQPDMTLAVGHHRDGGTGVKDKDKAEAPVVSSGNEPTAGSSADKAVPAEAAPASDPGAAGASRAPGTAPEHGTEPAAAPQEGDSAVPEANAARTLTESLRRNLFKLLNPLELCRYVSSIGLSLQAAAEGRRCDAREGGIPARIPGETQSLQAPCQAEEADKGCPRERERTQGLSEQDQMPDENVSLGGQDAELKSAAQHCEKLCVEPETERIFGACERAGARQAAAEMPSAAKNAASQAPSLRRAPGEKRAGPGQEVLPGRETMSDKSQSDVSAFPVRGEGSAPDKQDCLCAVLSSAKLCDEPGEGERRAGFAIAGARDPDIPCGPAGDELAFHADPEPGPESGEPGCQGDADISAVHDRLWKLLQEDDSDRQIPFANGGVAIFETSPTDPDLTELSFARETRWDHPLPMDVREEREPLGEPAQDLSAGEADPAYPAGVWDPGHPEGSTSRGIESVPGEVLHSLKDCGPAGGGGGGAAHFPAGQDVFPSENTWQLTRAERSPVNAVRGVNFQEEGSHSVWSAQNASSDGCHLPEINGCQDFRVVSAAQKCGSVTQLPALIKIPETTTHKNRPRNAERLTGMAEQEGEFAPSSQDLLLRDFQLEVPSWEPAKAGGDQRETHTTEERGAEISRDSGVNQVSESQAATSLPYTADQRAFLAGEEFQTGPSRSPSCASRGGTSTSSSPGRARGEPRGAAGRELRAGDGLDFGAEALLFLAPGSHSESLLASSPAVACPGAGSRVQSSSPPAGGKGDGNLSALGSWGGPGETKGETASRGNEQESPRAMECSPEEAEAKAALHPSVSSQAQIVNTSAEQPHPAVSPSSEVTEAECSMPSTQRGAEAEIRAAESAGSGSVHLPPLGSGSSRRFPEQAPRSRAQPFSSSALAPREPLLRDQDGPKPRQAPEQDPTKGGHGGAGAKKELPSAAVSKKPRLEEKGSGSKDAASCLKKAGKSEAGGARKPEQRKLSLKKDSKAPRLLKKIQAELFPERSGNVTLCCQFGDIHGDSTVTWTKDSQVLAQLQRSAQDDSPVSLEIPQASPKDQGMYYCCLKNIYGKVTAEFHLTAAVLERLSSSQSYEGAEEIEFMQLLFRDDSMGDSYFGGRLRGVLATEALHFGEGMHRRAFRSRVRQGLAPVFAPGHPCVLKVHSALSHGAGSREELVRRNYDLALQECCVQNAAREYARRYAAEAETLEGFGEVPEVIPIFLIHRPANNIPYATVEEELVGEFVKYSVRDGKEVNFLRRDSEAGQKCCTFQHWVYEKTSGNLLVTDLQGVGMKLTDVGIATLAKGYKGFKGNCSFSFIEQFRALHQCNEYCEMLGLKSLRAPPQKQRKATASKSKNPTNPSAAKKPGPKKGREHRDFLSSQH